MAMAMDRMAVAKRGGALVAMLAMALPGGCRKPEPPPTEQPPEPVAAAAPPSSPDTRLRDAIQAPQDRARAVEGVVEDAAARRRAEVEAQTGGDAP